MIIPRAMRQTIRRRLSLQSLPATALLSTLAVTTVLAPSAAFGSSVNQDGRRTASTTVDGSFVHVVGNSFSPNSDQCVLYSTLSYDGTNDRMIQAGLVRCDGVMLTGTCPGGQTFVERYNGSNYYCKPGSSFTNGTAYSSTTSRISSTSEKFSGVIAGSDMEQAGFGLSTNIRAYAWGEATSGATGNKACPAPTKGTFSQWQRRIIPDGWDFVSGSKRYRHSSNMTNAPCWSTISTTDSDGGFHVD